ncbi:MAG: nucleotidyltransferase family protein [Verrucomicrobiae bacterium]|nr:nucleotidyltransferase family protein [Verrucomicrobiae bacterium]
MKALVLCAGFGTRLGSLTRDWPKPMLPLRGHPLLAYLLAHLQSQGFRDIAVNLHFRPEIIQDWFGDGSRWGLRLTYSHEEQLLGTAGAVRRLADFFRGESSFLVQYGDVLTDQDFNALIRTHREKQALATLLVHHRARSNSVVSLDPSGRVIGFLERPAEAERQQVASPWVNSGICIGSTELLEQLPDRAPCDLPRDVFAPLVGSGRLHAVPLTGRRCAIDSPERLAEARALVATPDWPVIPLVRDGVALPPDLESHA